MLRDVASGKELRRIPDLGGEVTWAGLAPDGVTLTAATNDGVLHVWDLGRARELARFWAHGGERIVDAAYAPSGSTLVTAGADGVLHRWDLTLARAPGERLLQDARRSAGLGLSGVELERDPDWSRTRLLPVGPGR